MRELTQEYLKQRLDYDPDTGIFTWKRNENMPSRWNTRFSGKQAGTVGRHGYMQVKIDYAQFRMHNLVWLYVHGFFPSEVGLELDHEDRNPSNNKLSNLKLVTRKENVANSSQTPSSTGERYITIDRGRFNVIVYISETQSMKSVGRYKTLEEAVSARDEFLGKAK